jgi:hypothetical protein
VFGKFVGKGRGARELKEGTVTGSGLLVLILCLACNGGKKRSLRENTYPLLGWWVLGARN